MMNAGDKNEISIMENDSSDEPQPKRLRQNERYRNCSEGTITLRASNVAKELTFENSTVFSSVEYINNVPWKIGIKCMPGRKLGVFLYLEENDVGKNSEVYAEYYFSLINQQNNLKTVSRPPRCDIVKAGAAYGDSSFMPMDEMLHPYNNYVVDDQVIIEAYVSCGTLITNKSKNELVGNSVQREKELSEYMCNRVNYIISNGIGSDCDLVFTKNGEQVVKRACKAILARISPVFEKMFFGNPAVEGQVKITNVEEDVFDVVLLYAYGVKCDLKSKDRAVALYLAACAYEIKDLQYICAEYMWPRVLSDVWLFLFLPDMPDLEQMKVAAVKVFARCASEGFISEQFTHISYESLASIVSQVALNVRSELEVFDGVLHWAKTQCLQQKLEETTENLRRVTGEALNMVRFLSMTHGEFESSPMLSNILTPEEKVVILTRIIYKKKSSPLERLCSLVKPRLRM